MLEGKHESYASKQDYTNLSNHTKHKTIDSIQLIKNFKNVVFSQLERELILLKPIKTQMSRILFIVSFKRR
jgi:hypothetical protein